MQTLSLPFISFGLVAFFLGSLISWRASKPRAMAVSATLIALISFSLAAREVAAAGHVRLADPLFTWVQADAINAVPMAFFAALTLMLTGLAPRRDAGGPLLAGMLLIALATTLAYAAANLIALVIGWWLTALPFVLGLFGRSRGQKVTQIFLIAGSLALTAAIVVLHDTEIADLSHAGWVAFGLLIVAVILHKGIFPLHSWQVIAFEQGPLLPSTLLFNSHLGALLIARSETAALPQTARHTVEILGMAALITALITSLRGFAVKQPRHLLALICVSQASFILAGLATANVEGITGALIHWLVVAAASSGLIAVVRLLEVRVKDAAAPLSYLGLAVKAPRLATFFLLSGFALIGLPGTLGYCAEDLLFHGALESYPLLGIALPVATAFNAIHLIRLFNLLFLGVLPKHVIDIPDALPRERWPLAACAVFLIAGGLLPALPLSWRTSAAQGIAAIIGAKSAHESPAPDH